MKDRIVLAVGAHADDCEFCCGGTLARFAKTDHKVFICNMLVGDKAEPPGKTEAEVIATRRKEAEDSAAVIGAELIYGALDIKDGEFNSITKEINDRFIDVVRYTNPDIIITHPPSDYIHDHHLTSQLVFHATHFCAIPRYETRHKAISKSPRIYYMDAIAGVEFVPYEFVDITDTLETKIQMLSMYKSQLAFVEKDSGFHQTDLMDFLRTTAAYRGNQCGVRYAEGFKRLNAWLRNPVSRDLP